MHGAFGLGGPFVINAISKEFETKSHLRTTMAVFFVGFNVVRIIQLSIQGQIQPQLIFSVWWAVLPVFIAIYLGHKVHLAISETTFKKLISAMTLFAGIMFLLK